MAAAVQTSNALGVILPPSIGAHVAGRDGLCLACEETYCRFAIHPCPWATYARSASDPEARARQTLFTAGYIASVHAPKGGLCSCGSSLPCNVADVMEERSVAAMRELQTLLGDTRVMPTVAPAASAAAPAPVRVRRRDRFWRQLVARRRPAHAIA